VGRALRIPPDSGKTTGYVLIPVVRSDGEDAEAIISASSYAKIGEVIDALSQYDQTLDEILKEERRDRGRRGGLIGGSLRERIRWIGFEDINEDILYNETTVVLVENLVKNVWEIWGRLEQYLRENPHLDGWIPDSTPDRDIHRDAYAFRMQHTRGTLPSELHEAAEQVGFRWRLHRGRPRAIVANRRRPRLRLEEKITLLQAAIRQHGSVNIPLNSMIDGTGIFPETERYQREDGTMWDWPAGIMLKELRNAARGQRTTSYTNEDFDLIESLMDQHGNNVVLRHHSE
jgi:hypothetical protein